jgi:hypothetical protein
MNWLEGMHPQMAAPMVEQMARPMAEQMASPMGSKWDRW